MRLWSLYPSLLDRQGLVALWREGLLAQKVLHHKTKGYKNHPQLLRFKNTTKPEQYINAYLHEVLLEAQRRNYHFDATKIKPTSKLPRLTVTTGQLNYELKHLQKKLAVRDPQQLKNITSSVSAHPLFRVVAGDIAEWEKLS